MMKSQHASDISCVAVLGPTGSGKTDLAVELAQQLNGEIVSCDSMQVYRQMNVGTAKPSTVVRSRVRHHLVDIVDIHEPYNLSRFLQDASQSITDIMEKGKTPILCGGTGLYIRALLSGYELAPTDRTTADTVLRECKEPGGEQRLRQELAQYDSNLACSLTNTRRLIRAVEIARISGRSPAPSVSTPAITGKVLQYVLCPEGNAHRQWICNRTYAMFRAGWLGEVKSLLKQDWLRTPTARQALGYRRIARFLLTGNGTLKELQQQVFRETWQYVRRQRTWFRNKHPEAEFLQVDETTDFTITASEMWK